jgi:hypothetical protein
LLGRSVHTMSRKKRVRVHEYEDPLAHASAAPAQSGEITTHHTHYEPYRRPKKSTITITDLSPTQDSAVIVTSDSSSTQDSMVHQSLADSLEQAEDEGRNLELNGLENAPAETQKRRRTQGVSFVN